MNNKFDTLREDNKKITQDIHSSIIELNNLSNESKRVSEVAHNANIITSDLDAQFKKATKLKKIDIAFLFLATALQITRQYLIATSKHNYLNEENRLNDQEAAGQHTYEREYRNKKLYMTTPTEIITNPVPFDIQNGSSNLGVNLGGGKYHRLHTFGHDPILGWIFGTANIATRTCTTAPDFRSYHVKYGNFTTKSGSLSLRPDDFFHSNANTLKVLDYGIINRIKNCTKNENLEILVLAIAKEAAHLKSDWATKKSLALPFTSLKPDLAKSIANYGIDMASVGTVLEQAALAQAINVIISIMHKLLVSNSTRDSDFKLLQVRTNKIISYSNLIATGTNIAYVSITKKMSSLDIGGFMITIYKLITNSKFQADVKKEFLTNGFYNTVING